MWFIRELREVEAHGKNKLHVIHTNDLQKEQHLKYQCHKIIRVDVEYTNEPTHEQKVSLVQLSISKTQPMLLFQLSVAEDKCTTFDNFLHDPRYTFAGFGIDGDMEKLDRIGLEIGRFIDIQKELRVPESTKYMNFLGDISNILIDDYCTDMKHQMSKEDQGYWAKMPLSKKHIEYAAKDSYATYEKWNRITITQDGLCRAKMEKSKKCARTWGHSC
ncbi:hypothetical protein ZWY2020_014789 [Hordeum vulgare]|nr:hypothetical protein ZWY2020_014789 [Hordeum vulgare]